MTRWNRRLLFGAVVVLVPALAGCEAGFNAPTLEYHPANFAGNTTQNGISFANVFVVDTATNGEGVAGGRAGVFLSLYAKNGDRLESASANEAASSVKIAGGSVNLPAGVPVNMGGPIPRVVLTGLTDPLEGGQTVSMSFTFAKAGTITIPVPVEPKAFDYATYSPPASPSPSPSATGKKKAGGSASASASPSATP